MHLFILIILSLFLCRPLAENTGIDAIRFIPLITFIAGTFRYIYVRRGVLGFSIPKEKKGILLYFVIVLLYGISIFRVSGGGVTTTAVVNYIVQFVLIFTLFYFFTNFLYVKKGNIKEISQDLIKGVLIALNIFLLINFVIYLFGLGALATGAFEVDEYSTLAGIFGIPLKRDGFFLTGHPNSFGGFLAMMSVLNYLAFFYLKLSRIEKLSMMLMLGICAFAFLLVDSRGAVGAAGLTILAIEILRRIRSLWILPKASIFIPILSLFAIGMLQVFAETDIAKSISRDPDEMATGNNRGVIWKYCVEELQEFELEHVWGYGQLGHIQSGVSKKWSRAMKGWNTYTHNFLFQVIFDIGYLGLFCLLYFVFIGANYSYKMYKKGEKYMVLFLGIPILYMLSGITEAPFGISNYLYTNLFFVLFLIPILIEDLRLKSTTDTPSQSPEVQAEIADKATGREKRKVGTKKKAEVKEIVLEIPKTGKEVKEKVQAETQVDKKPKRKPRAKKKVPLTKAVTEKSGKEPEAKATRVVKKVAGEKPKRKPRAKKKVKVKEGAEEKPKRKKRTPKKVKEKKE